MKFICCLVFTIVSHAHAKLSVVATTADIGALIEAVAGDNVGIEVIAKGTQDPHYLEAKPSYMVKLAKAELLVSNGLSLETGWLPNLIAGGRNPKVNSGEKGNLELGKSAEPLDVAKGAVSRADGDVHPEGNPHFMLDPIRVGKLALVVAERLAGLDEAHRSVYLERARKFQQELESKTKAWQERVKASGVKKVITYHPDLTYFLNRFGIEAAGYLEPKPGIPPTAQHLLQQIEVIKKQKIPLILIESYFDTKIAERLAASVPGGVKIKVIGIAVGSEPDLKTTSDVVEQIIRSIESAK